MATPIGGDWVEAVDDDSGHTYYSNSVTGVTQWEYPSELQATETAPEAAAQVWVKGVDPDSGHPYWYNSDTGESSWEQPADWVDPASSAIDASSAKAGLSLSAGSKMKWIKILSHVKLKARKNLGGASFGKFAKFAELGAKKKQ